MSVDRPPQILNEQRSEETVIRVASFHAQHPYHRAIYDCLKPKVIDGRPALSEVRPPSRYGWKQWDVFHVHWPEWLLPQCPHVDWHYSLVESLQEACVRIVWTQHNLLPHSKDERFREIYSVWARAADGVIHHSEWGMEQVLRSVPFQSSALHRVIPIPHGYIRKSLTSAGTTTVAAASRSSRLRIGIIGAHRQEKDIDLALEAFKRCKRQDLELVVLSPPLCAEAPVDQRIIFLKGPTLAAHEYIAWVMSMDVLLMPFATTGMLGTGTVSDAIGFCKPVLISEWPFLSETLGRAAIPYGRSADDLAATLCRLEDSVIGTARAAACELQARYEPSRIADQTFKLLVAMTTAQP